MSVMNTKGYKRLKTLTKRLGGQIIQVDWKPPQDDWLIERPVTGMTGFSTAPFCNGLGVYYKKKVIAHGKDGFTLSGIIHEMGHIFACKVPPNSNDCDETTFLGWELTLARRLGLTHLWMNEMGSYGVHVLEDGTIDDSGDFEEIRHLEDKQLEVMFASAIKTAQKLGSVGRRGELYSLR